MTLTLLRKFLQWAKDNWELLVGALLIAVYTWVVADWSADRVQAQWDKERKELGQQKQDVKEELAKSDAKREEKFSEKQTVRAAQRQESRGPANEYREKSPARVGDIGDDGLRRIAEAIACRDAPATCRNKKAVPEADASGVEEQPGRR